MQSQPVDPSDDDFLSFFNLSFSNNDIPLLPVHAPRSETAIRTPYQIAAATPDLRVTSKMSPVQIPHSDALVAVSRQEAYLQGTLQHLLDAQSEGLLAGLAGRPPQDETSSTSRRTPTPVYSSSGGLKKPKSIVPVRQPAKRRVGLKGARRGIARAISDLASLKIEERTILEGEILQRVETVSTAQRFETKTVGLKEHIDSIESEDTSRQVEDLKGEEKALDREIQELESRLWEMKARHRHLLHEIEGLDNSVQSKLSSFRSALTLAEKESRQFLARPPIGGNRTVTASGLWALPADRRTLHMVQEHYAEEQDVLRERYDAVEKEKDALEAGSGVWDEVIEEVDDVERLLREEMRGMQASLVPENGVGDRIGGMRKILERILRARSRIESKLEVAEARDWKLLVCCIGAELEAMTEGQAVLQNAFEAAQRPIGEGNIFEDGNALISGPRPVSPVDLSEGLEEMANKDPAEARGILDRSDDEDDGPGPDLLISSDDV